MDINKISNLQLWLEGFPTKPDSLIIPISNTDVTRVCEEIVLICKYIEKTEPVICNNLMAYRQLLFVQQTNCSI